MQLGARPHPWHCMPVVRGTLAGGRGICEDHSMPGHLLQGHSCPKKQGVWPRAEGLVAFRSDCHSVCAVLPRPSRNSAVKPVLKRSHMKQTERGYRRCSCHMPQELLKKFQWDRCPAPECIQAVQHRLQTNLGDGCTRKCSFCVSILNGSLWRLWFKTRRSKIGRNPPLFLGTMK